MTNKKRLTRATMLLKKTFKLPIGVAKKLAKNFLNAGIIDTDVVWDTLGDKKIDVIHTDGWDTNDHTTTTTIMVDGIDLGNLFWTHPSVWGNKDKQTHLQLISGYFRRIYYE